MKRKVSWLVVLPLILFVLLAISIAAGSTTGFEGWAYDETVEHMSPILTALVKVITHIGDASSVICFCLLLFALPKSRKTIACPVSVAVIVSTILNILLKNVFSRQRPDILRLIIELNYSFPSGHAMNNAALYTILILLIFRYIENPVRKYSLTALCVALNLSIGLSRIYLGVHYAGDVLGGWLIGFAVAVLVDLFWQSQSAAKQSSQ
ncbi:MAG: phosphatase PAP2 family protein [Negativicutes bacterium]|nr:phosphatase PAP2 family protein [Negativicutes bacterium]